MAKALRKAVLPSRFLSLSRKATSSDEKKKRKQGLNEESDESDISRHTAMPHGSGDDTQPMDVEKGAPVPSPEKQASMIDELVRSEKLKAGDTWALVSAKWFSQWKRYTGYHSALKGSESDMPGPIDNSEILDNNGELKPYMTETMHFTLLHKATFDVMVGWYGMVPGQAPLLRPVIGKDYSSFKVEVYKILVNVAEYTKKDVWVAIEVSRADTVKELRERFTAKFGLPDDSTVRLWTHHLNRFDEELKDPSALVADMHIYGSSKFMLERKNDAGEWPSNLASNHSSSYPSSSSSSYPSTYSSSASSSSGAVGSSSASSYPSSYSVSAASSSSSSSRLAPYSSYGSSSYGSSYGSSLVKKYTPGLCGLNNLGNTCFMNSALQCLSHTEALTEFFLSRRFERDINRSNPIGCKGKLADEYAELLSTLWGGSVGSTAPRELKYTIGKFAPQFEGYQQHDSQELLAFLLDGLHEDLNRILKKPYVEQVSDGGRPDEVVAAEAWQNHLKRNSSIITDLFHGQFKSTLVCPECQKISITFDPFMYLSLPLVDREEKVVPVVVVFDDPARTPVRYGVTVPKNTGTIRHLKEKLQELSGVKEAHMRICEIFSHRFHKVFPDDGLVKDIYEKDLIYAFELLPSENPADDVFVQIVHRYEKTAASNYSSYYYSAPRITWELFGVPTIVRLSASKATYADLYRAITHRLTPLTIHGADGGAAASSAAADAASTHGEQQQQELDDDNALENAYRQNASKRAALDPMDLSEGNGASGVAGADPAAAEEKHFTLTKINSYGSTNLVRYDPQDETPLGLIAGREDVFISADWEKQSLAVFDKDGNASVVDDESIAARAKRSGDSVTLDDCLNLFEKQEKLSPQNMWRCPVCKKEQQADKKMELWKLPQVLVIQLKRFSYNSYFRDKLSTIVDFPLENLDLSKHVLHPDGKSCVYDLFAVSNHMGGMGGGHYTAYAKQDGKWHNFDDSYVSDASLREIVGPESYVLFYQRRD